jgi:hypothetical protein
MLIKVYATKAATIAEKPCDFTSAPSKWNNPIVRSEVMSGTRRNELPAIIQNLCLLFSNEKSAMRAIRYTVTLPTRWGYSWECVYPYKKYVCSLQISAVFKIKYVSLVSWGRAYINKRIAGIMTKKRTHSRSVQDFRLVFI